MGGSFCDVSLELSDRALIERRTYTKLVDILSNIRGFIQVIYSFLRIISSFSIHILYETSLVNIAILGLFLRGSDRVQLK